jgi:hypothetical protein
VFGVDYGFLSCGPVFTEGLAHAAADLGVAYAHTLWSDPSVLAQIAQFQPDLVFVVHGRRFAQTWPVPPASAVWLLDEPYEVDDTRQWAQKFGHVFVCDPATLDCHAGSTTLPVCYDPHVHTPSADPRPYAVGFIGGGNGARERYLGALVRAGLLSYVVGGAWADPALQAICLAPNIQPRQTAALYQHTRIVVNVFREVHHFNHALIPATALNPRVYEALACGALVVSEWRPEVDRVVPELPTFTTEADCVELVGQLLADPVRAETIRLQCAARLQPCTYARRLRTVLSTVGLATEAIAV